jgi:hypothetical protein
MNALMTNVKVTHRAKWKARRLTRRRKRNRLAAGIERMIAHAEAPPERLSSAIPVHSRAVLAVRDQLAQIAERLRGPAPVYAQGVALVDALLANSDGPLYQVRLDLRGAVEQILAALDGHFDHATNKGATT